MYAYGLTIQSYLNRREIDMVDSYAQLTNTGQPTGKQATKSPVISLMSDATQSETIRVDGNRPETLHRPLSIGDLTSTPNVMTLETERSCKHLRAIL